MDSQDGRSNGLPGFAQGVFVFGLKVLLWFIFHFFLGFLIKHIQDEVFVSEGLGH